MNMLLRLSACALIPLLSSCETKPEPGFPSTITGIDRTIYVDATCASGKAILISHADILTLETAEQIGDHNQDLWCRCPEKRPEGFKAEVCRV